MTDSKIPGAPPSVDEMEALLGPGYEKAFYGSQFWAKYGWNMVLVVEIIGILLLWEFLVSGLELWNPKFVPPPSDVFAAFRGLFTATDFQGNPVPFIENPIWEDIRFSATSFLYGYLLGASTGIIIGVAIGSSKLLDMMIGPFVWTVYAIPRSALAPVLVLVFKLGLASKIAMVFLFVLFVVVINTMEGIRTVSPELVRAGRVFGAGRKDLIMKVVLPYVLPFVLVGLRIGVVRGWIGVILGEFVGSKAGLGLILRRAAFNFETAESLAVVILFIVMANGSMLIMQGVKRLVVPWHHDEGRLY